MRRSIATLLLLVLPLTACHRWAAPEVRPDVGPDRAATYEMIRVRTVDGETRVLRRAEVRPDSVIGYDEEPERLAAPSPPPQPPGTSRVTPSATPSTASRV